MRTFVASLLLLLSTVAAAAPDNLLQQGRLFDALGDPLAGSTNIDVALWDTPSGGTALWTESHTESLDDGYYTLELGSSTAFPAGLWDNDELFLSMSINGGPDLTRIELQAVNHAFRAEHAQTADSATVADLADGLTGTLDWSQVSNVSGTIATLGCSDGQLPTVASGAWTCVGATAHQHSFAEVTGVIDISQIPVGGSSSDVAAGDHSHASTDWNTLSNRPSGLDDGDDVLDEATVEGFVTNDALSFSGSVGVGSGTNDAAAALQVDSTTQGFLPPRMSTAQRTGISSPPAGLMVFDTDLGWPVFYDGTDWRRFDGRSADNITLLEWVKVTPSGQLSSGIGTNTVFTATQNVTQNYSSVVLNHTFTGDFEVVAEWGHTYVGMGIIHGVAVDYADHTGYSADGNGPYWGAIGTTGYPSGYAGTFIGQYHAGGKGNNTQIWGFRWTRSGNTVRIQTSSSGPSGPWNDIGGPYTIPSNHNVIIGIGEAGPNSGGPLRLLSVSAEP